MFVASLDNAAAYAADNGNHRVLYLDNPFDFLSESPYDGVFVLHLAEHGGPQFELSVSIDAELSESCNSNRQGKPKLCFRIHKLEMYLKVWKSERHSGIGSDLTFVSKSEHQFIQLPQTVRRYQTILDSELQGISWKIEPIYG